MLCSKHLKLAKNVSAVFVLRRIQAGHVETHTCWVVVAAIHTELRISNDIPLSLLHTDVLEYFANEPKI